jgi:hypothetical protein
LRIRSQSPPDGGTLVVLRWMAMVMFWLPGFSLLDDGTAT